MEFDRVCVYELSQRLAGLDFVVASAGLVFPLIYTISAIGRRVARGVVGDRSSCIFLYCFRLCVSVGLYWCLITGLSRRIRRIL
jgi:hypothetical protein